MNFFATAKEKKQELLKEQKQILAKWYAVLDSWSTDHPHTEFGCQVCYEAYKLGIKIPDKGMYEGLYVQLKPLKPTEKVQKMKSDQHSAEIAAYKSAQEMMITSHKAELKQIKSQTLKEVAEKVVSLEEFPGYAPDLDKECPEWLQAGTICSHPDGLFCDHRAIVVNKDFKINFLKLLSEEGKK